MAALVYGLWRWENLDRNCMHSRRFPVFFFLVLASFVVYMNTPTPEPIQDYSVIGAAVCSGFETISELPLTRKITDV